MNSHRIAAAAAAAALLLASCSPGSDVTSRREEASPRLSAGHVHGLGTGPGGCLYVATHEGLFTAKGGVPQRVGDSRDDFMGFTVAGKKRFLASGHPSPGAGGPPNRGLIESTDAGKTWKPASLSGKADFHSLDYAGGAVYGYDSTTGRLRVHTDGTGWDSRAKLQALDLAVDPQDRETVVATTVEGIARSTDGGRTFRVGGGAVMAFVSWAKSGALFGVDAAGTVHRSRDGGRSWKKTATVPGGPPQALTATGTPHVLVATQTGIYESKDSAERFTQRLALARTHR